MHATIVPHEHGSASRQLITELWRGGSFGYWYRLGPGRYIDKNGTEQPERESQWFPTDNPAPIPQRYLDGNCYFGVHPVGAIPTATRKDGRPVAPKWLRGRIANISSIGCLFAEYDLKQYGTHDAIMAHLETLPLYPTGTVGSAGTAGGVHAYWLLEYPVAVDDTNRDHIRQVQATWVDLVAGDDGAKDLARVLRVPGTCNRKYAGAPKVTILEYRQSRVYHFDRLAALVAGRVDELRRAEERQREIDRDRDTEPAAGSTDFLLSWAIAHAKAGGRHAMMLWLAGRLFKEGVPRSAATDAATEFAKAVSNGDAPKFSEAEAKAAVKYVFGGAA